MNELDKIKAIPLYSQTNIQTVICLASEWLAGSYCLGAATELAELQARIKADVDCLWGRPGEDEDIWETSCKNAWMLDEGTPESNGMKFCCYCGRPIAQVVAE